MLHFQSPETTSSYSPSCFHCLYCVSQLSSYPFVAMSLHYNAWQTGCKTLRWYFIWTCVLFNLFASYMHSILFIFMMSGLSLNNILACGITLLVERGDFLWLDAKILLFVMINWINFHEKAIEVGIFKF